MPIIVNHCIAQDRVFTIELLLKLNFISVLVDPLLLRSLKSSVAARIRTYGTDVVDRSLKFPEISTHVMKMLDILINKKKDCIGNVGISIDTAYTNFKNFLIFPPFLF